ncbi:cell surface A33 antigen isoform X4 [Syngnathus acus]|uniref:cell surface A33 antigen isoform X3 n=1 Tax=Syngnathus acus TaxID=161584 RepID=UPI00188604A9|nr:cell surface A33 antigen isoform X3 [Syngnathus acus]XP_037096180.1 cell surface A33 antigen isoform X4 [Syngnathus acus]
MTAKQRLEWQNLLLILTVLPACRSLHVSIPQDEYEATNGADITLTCSFTPANPVFTMLVLTWEAYPDVVEDPTNTVATYFLNNPIDIAPAYEGRAFMEVDVAKQQSTLRLTKLTVDDSRSFQCNVKIPNDDEGTTAASTSLLVLVPPSKPVCGLQGAAEYWHDVTLTCMSQEGSPKPTYKWKRYSVENIPRPFPPKTTEKDGALSLFNISRETSGFYICESTNRVGSDSCNFTLAVMPSSMNLGATGGIIGGVVAGFILLGILIFCCYKKRSKKNKNVERSSKEIEFIDDPEARGQCLDEESNAITKQTEYKDAVPQNSHNMESIGLTSEEDNHGSDSGRYPNERDQDRQSDHGSRNRLDRNEYRGSRDRLDEDHDGRDRLDDHRNQYGGSRDRQEERNDYRGNRDRLEERNDYRGSRDRLEERNDYRGSRDRLEERNDYRGSRDRLDERNDYRGSRDRLDEQRDRYGGSRDRLEDQSNYKGSRDRLDDQSGRYGGNR